MECKGRYSGGGSRSFTTRYTYYSPSYTRTYVSVGGYYGGYYYGGYYGSTTYVYSPYGILTFFIILIAVIVIIVLISKYCGSDIVVEDGFHHQGEVVVVEEHHPGHTVVVEQHYPGHVVEH